MSAALPTTRRGVVARLIEPLERAYLAFRLRHAEADLESYQREAKNRIAQMEAHRKHCEALRVRLALITNR